MKILRFLLPLALLTSACQKDFDFDKISSGVSLKPSLLVPTVCMDASVRYLFDENADAIEYYTAADGTHRLKLRAERDSSMVYSLMDVLQVHSQNVHSEGRLDLRVPSFDVPASGDAMSASADVLLPIGCAEDVTLVRLSAGCRVSLSYSGFDVPSTLSVSIGKDSKSVSVSGSGTQVVSWDDVEAPVSADGNVVVGLSVSAKSDGKGNFGVVNYDVALSEAHSVTFSTSGYDFQTGMFTAFTNMNDLRSIARKGEFRDPQISLSCTNTSELDISVDPHMKSCGYDLVLLDARLMEVPAKANGYLFNVNKRNSNVADFFQNVPDSVSYDANVRLSMPAGAADVTVFSSDSIFLGYRYLVPIEVMFDGELNCDTIMLGDNMDAISEARRGSLVVSAANSLPVGASFVIQFVNTVSGESFSLVDLSDVVPAPRLTDEGVALDTARIVSTVDLSESNLDDLRRADALIVRSSLTTANRYVVPKLEDGLKLDISLAAQFEFNNY